MPTFQGQHVVVTGGAGALGGAVVDAFTAAGAVCHVPRREETEPTDEAALAAYSVRLPAVAASAHLGRCIAIGALLVTSLAAFRTQVDLDLAACFLANRKAARRLRTRGGRIVGV